MRSARKASLVGLPVVLAAVIVGASAVVGGASAATQPGVHVSCVFHMRDTGPYKPKGTYRAGPGSAKCSQPFGKGSYAGRYRDRVFSFPTSVSETGSSKLHFHGGTVHGRYRFSGNYRTQIMHGVMHITGGTGGFQHVAGKLRLKCTKQVPNAECRGSGTLSGIS